MPALPLDTEPLRAPAAELPLDFALLQQSARGAGRNRAALAWLLGLLTLLVASVLALAVYLRDFEADEAARRRAADAQWLEQSVQFHFRRLEDDLRVLARQVVLHPGKPVNTLDPEGLGWLWRSSGVLLGHGWLAAGAAGQQVLPPGWAQAVQAHPDNARALQDMVATSRGLRRAAYAGPMRQGDGSASDVVWLAVPYFERGLFVGNAVAAIAMQPALVAMVPAWFSHDHRVSLLLQDARPAGAGDADRVALNLPGLDLQVQVALSQAQGATVPRFFFLLALLFLAGMGVSLWALRRDIAKRQEVQALLRAQVALRSAMESSVTLGLRAWDLQGRILYVNDAFSRLVGFAPRELLGCSMPFPYWPADQHEHLVQVHASIMAHGTAGEGVEVQFAHRDGHLIDVLIHEAPLTTAAGVQVGWMSSVLDISERKRAQRQAALQQERLQASGRLVAVGEVASTLAHELNQPLGALSSFANGLLNRLKDGRIDLADVLPVVQRMARLAERAGGIIARVNAFARRRELSRQRLDLAALVGEVLGRADEVPEPVPVHTQVPAQPLWLLADALLLEHLLANLLSNARYWAARGPQPGGAPAPQVLLALQPQGGEAVLSVVDTGPGVSAQDASTIFDAFVSRKEGGMGMGLAICRSIVEAHQGRIEVGRDPTLGGARFTVFLPLEAP
jgi:two-component system sensor histidine kinase DctS